jgi:hypothetical protein
MNEQRLCKPFSAPRFCRELPTRENGEADRRKLPQTRDLGPDVAVNLFVLIAVSGDHRRYRQVLRFVVRSGTFGRFLGLFGE